jgi:predicted regulator of Ras-like GTPase activity (Roadblock/LC7/MglB family)
MKPEAEKAFKEMLDISTDIDKALVLEGDTVVASNVASELEDRLVGWIRELVSLGGARAKEMGDQPLTQLVVETALGLVFVVRESAPGGMTVMATGRKGARVGLVLYDMKTCIRDTREPLATATQGDSR